MKKILTFALCVASAAAAQAPTFTLNQVLSYPYPLELTAAPNGAAVAWVFNEQGVRNIYEAQAPDWAARKLTRFTVEDGQELGQLSFTPDGKTVVYVRGGDHDSNWPNETPDPTLNPLKPSIEIWAVNVSADSAPRVLTEGDAPVVSPKGDRVAFIRGGQAYVVSLTSGKPAAQLFYARGTTGELVWSPDGSQLAFVSERGDHSFIGLFTNDSTPLRFLAPAASYDFNPRWSPDGKRIAFIRVPGQGGAPEPFLKLTPSPWSIRVVDVATGADHLAWQSPKTLRGSFPETAGNANLAWGAGDVLIFLADLDNWPHLYTVPAAGGAAPTLLTAGNFMVEHVSVSSDHKFIVYSANTGGFAGDDARRHLFRLAVDRTELTALTTGAGIQWTPVITGDMSAVAFISSDVQRPPVPAVYTFGSAQAARLLGADRIPADWPGAQFVVPKAVSWKAADGTLIHGQLFENPAFTGKRPAVVFVHGGPPRQMMLGWHYMDYYSNSYAVNQYLASRGFVVLTVNYRLGIGYGHDFHHPPHAGPAGAAEYQDVLAGGRYLASLPNVDPKRVGIWGGSYGGYLTAMALARNSNVFAVGVDLHGVHDWVSDIRDAYAPPGWRYERGDIDSAKVVGWKSSPVSSMAGWKSPVLLIQGDADGNVRYSQTVDLARRLDAAGVEYELIVFPDDIHGFLLHKNWMTADSATAAYLEKKIGTTH
jgi:dipeptidyl aminopeptidase/acylaminoacyl peptidase